MAPPTTSPAFDLDGFAERFSTIASNVAVAVQGKPDVIELVLLCLVAEGHLLIEDVPGVGKTNLAKALAVSIDGRWSRVQFTPDLLPSDIVGVSVWNRDDNTFDFKHGAVFANLLVGDEINRASPKTQSALLEAMQERQVTVDGTTHPLPAPFMVVATQNPIEHEGTYLLPKSQLDRFLMRVSVGYPARDAELEILDTQAASPVIDKLEPVATLNDVIAMAALARDIYVAPSLKGYLVDLATTSRVHPSLSLGMSPRATLALQRAARARAAASGRAFVTPDDIKVLAPAVLGHRLVLTPEAAVQGADAARVVDEVLHHVPVPANATER